MISGHRRLRFLLLFFFFFSLATASLGIVWLIEHVCFLSPSAIDTSSILHTHDLQESFGIDDAFRIHSNTKCLLVS